MTVDLFAASFICRDAELGSVLQIGRWPAASEADRALPLSRRIGLALRRPLQARRWGLGPARPARDIAEVA